MLNPTTCLKQLETEINKTLNLKLLTVFSNSPIPSDVKKTAVVEIKNIKQDEIKFSIKIIINKNLGYEACLKLTNKLTKLFYTSTSFIVVDLQNLPIYFDKINQVLCQETQVTLKEFDENLNSILIFNSETIKTQKNTTLTIERQPINLGLNLENLQFIDLQKPIKKIKGSAQISLEQFNRLLNMLNSKKIAPIKFKNQSFNATLIELSINSTNLANFTFLEAPNETDQI